MIYRRQSNTFQFDENHISQGAQSIAFIMHEVMFLMKFLQRKTQFKIINFYDMYDTVIRNLSDEVGEN